MINTHLQVKIFLNWKPCAWLQITRHAAEDIMVKYTQAYLNNQFQDLAWYETFILSHYKMIKGILNITN